MNYNRKENRLVARTSPDVHATLQRAADYSGTTLSQFLIECAMEKARSIIERTETLHLSKSAADALFEALENPPEPNQKLINAFKEYKANVNVPDN